MMERKLEIHKDKSFRDTVKEAHEVGRREGEGERERRGREGRREGGREREREGGGWEGEGWEGERGKQALQKVLPF